MNVLITAGPTREYIDPIRFITNASSGKMGYCLAETAIKNNNKVILISGNVHIPPPKNIKPIYVKSANEMHTQVMKHIDKTDIFISCAAVSDFHVDKIQVHKIKKTHKPIILKLIPNIDILSAVNYKLKRSGKRNKKILIGFALETDNIIKNAYKKLKDKNLDLIIANPISSIDNKFTEAIIIDKKNNIKKIRKCTKEQLSKIIWSKIKKIIINH